VHVSATVHDSLTVSPSGRLSSARVIVYVPEVTGLVSVIRTITPAGTPTAPGATPTGLDPHGARTMDCCTTASPAFGGPAPRTKVTSLPFGPVPVVFNRISALAGASLASITRSAQRLRPSGPGRTASSATRSHRPESRGGTIGGSQAHADASAERPLVFRALDGVATVRSASGERAVPASDFFVYTVTPAIEPDELLAEVWLPLPAPRTGQAFVEVARRHGDFALVAVAASLTLDPHGICTDVRIAIGGAAPVPMRASVAEDSVRGERASLERFREAGKIAAGEMEPTGDVHADAEYRREGSETLTARAVLREPGEPRNKTAP